MRTTIYYKKIFRKIIPLLCAGVFSGSVLFAQAGTINLLSAGTYTQNFNSPSTVSLPVGWTIDKYGGSSGSTTFDALTVDGVSPSIGASTARGAYKYGTSEDYALGFMSSGSFGPNNYKNIKATIKNETGGVITALEITFKYEKYRSGSRAWDFKFYAGGVERTAGSHFWPADANSTTPYTPSSAPTVNKTVTISGLNILPNQTYQLRWEYAGVGGLSNAQGLALDDVSITPVVLSCDPPTLQAHSISFDNIDAESAEVAWANGNGDRRLVFIKETSSVSGNLTLSDGTDPSDIIANTTFGLGSAQGDGWYCVFNGTSGSSISIDGLSSLTDYRVQVIEMNDCDGGYKYNNSAASENPANFQTIQDGFIFAVESDNTAFCAGTSSTASISFMSDLMGVFVVELSDASGSFISPLEIGSGTESPVSVTMPDTLTTGSGYLLRVVNHDGGYFIGTNMPSLEISGPPVIVSYPSSVSVCEGSVLTLVCESGSSFSSYQWFKDGVLIDGATEGTYIVLSSSFSDSGVYTVSVSEGGCSVVSDSAVVSVNLFDIASVSRNLVLEHGPSSYQDYAENCEIIATISTMGTTDLGQVNASVTLSSEPVQVGGLGDWYIGRVYNIQVESQPTEPVEVMLYYTTAELEAYNAVVSAERQIGVGEMTSSLDNFYISLFHGEDEPGSELEDVLYPSSVVFNGHYWEIKVIVDEFSQFIAHGGNDVILPVELVDFTAKNVGKINVLNWETASEDEGEYIEIERSRDGRSFEKIATISSRGTASQYQFIDHEPFSGDNFYRLYIPEYDAGIYSLVVKATVADNELSLSLSPNPADHYLNVKLSASSNSGEIVISDVSGRRWHTEKTAGSSEIRIDVDHLPAGTYILQYNGSLYQPDPVKFVISR